MSLYDRMSHRELLNELDGEEKRLLAETDKTLVRVFRKAALDCLARGDQEGFEKWQSYLREAERGWDEQGTPSSS